MEKLKVGDKVYHKEYCRWKKETEYNLATVDRLSSKQAILSNGKRLINETIKDSYYKGDYFFMTYGDRTTQYHLLTDEISLEAKNESERIMISSWFSKQKFTDEEMKKIHTLLNKN